MAKYYEAWITAHNPDSLEVIGSLMVAKSTDRLTVERFIERYSETDDDVCKFKCLFEYYDPRILFKVSLKFPPGIDDGTELWQAFNVAAVALSTAQSRLNQLEAILKKKGSKQCT